MEVFSCKTKIISGTGSLWELGQMEIKRLLVVADPYFQSTNIPDKIKAAAKADACTFFYDVIPDPTAELAAKGTALLQACDPDTVIALGGGSAMDCAKAMVYFSGKCVRLIAVPTTSGSGSEVTDFAILTHGGSKHPLIDASLYPAVAILDGNLLTTLPKSLIADAGYDIIAHAVESFVATGAGAISRALARDAFASVCIALPLSFGGNTGVRQTVHLAASLAGIAFSQSGLGLCHALSHALGGQFHEPHGRLNAILLPAVVECNTAAAGLYADLARGAGLGGTADTMAVRSLKNALIRLRKDLQLPATLTQVGITPQQLQDDRLVEAVLTDPCCATNPVRPDKAMVRKVLGQVSGLG